MIKIMVDSASDCKNRSELYDLFVPLTVSLGGKDYKDGIDLDPDTFYNLLTREADFPKTSQPSPEEFAKHFEQVKQDGDSLLCFTLSSALSGTYQSACIAKEMVEYDGIYIIDSLGVTHMIAYLAQYAQARIREHADPADIARECMELRSKIQVFAGLDTLEYLYKGGRLSKASAAVGEIAGIKPIVHLTQEGVVCVAGKAIGVPRAIQLIAAKLQSFDVDTRYPICSLYTQGTTNLEKLEAKLSQNGHKITQRLQVGPTIGAHVGPGVYGLVFVSK